MFPFWLRPYSGRILSAIVLLFIFYFLAPNIFNYTGLWWIVIGAYLAGHWIYYLWRKFINHKVIAFDVGGVLMAGDYFTETVKPMPGMYDLIVHTRQKYITAVLSNNNRMVNYGFIKFFKANNMFDTIFYSSDFGVRKPDEKVYKRFADAMGVSPSEITFFDDDPVNVEAAKKVGFNSHLFKSADQVAQVVNSL